MNKVARSLKKPILFLSFAIAAFAVVIGSGSLAMASNTFNPYSSINKFSVDIHSVSHQMRDLGPVSDEQQQQFRQLAIEQARIWSDTILEGDFEAAGDTRVDLVQGVFAGDKLIAYRVTFSETAWSTAQCDYNPADKSTLVSCASGRIVESMFITLDLRNSERDERNFAHFVD